MFRNTSLLVLKRLKRSSRFQLRKVKFVIGSKEICASKMVSLNPIFNFQPFPRYWYPWYIGSIGITLAVYIMGNIWLHQTLESWIINHLCLVKYLVPFAIPYIWTRRQTPYISVWNMLWWTDCMKHSSKLFVLWGVFFPYTSLVYAHVTKLRPAVIACVAKHMLMLPSTIYTQSHTKILPLLQSHLLMNPLAVKYISSNCL